MDEVCSLLKLSLPKKCLIPLFLGLGVFDVPVHILTETAYFSELTSQIKVSASSVFVD
jgi:hypothetical protein